MTFERNFEEFDGWCRIVTTGKLDSLEVFLSKLHLGADMVTSTSLKRVLLDDRQVHVSVDPFDVSVGISQLADGGLPSHGLRIACLCRDEDLDIYKTIETMYRNRSVSFQLFPDEESAKDWLISD